MTGIRSTLEMVEREIARSEAFLQARGTDASEPRRQIDRRRRDELVHDLLEERRRRLEARLREEPVPEADFHFDGAEEDEPEQAPLERYASHPLDDFEEPEPLRASPPRPAARQPPARAEEAPETKTPARGPKPKPAVSGTKTRAPSAPRFVFNPKGRDAKGNSKLTRADEWVLRYEMQKRAREKEKEEQERATLDACTFRPQINARSEAYAQRLRAPSQEPLVSRLHHEADKRERLRAKARDLLEEEQVAAHAFAPKIKAHPAAAHQVPIHERVDEITRRKRENVNLRRVEQELGNKDLTFAPKLAVRSEKMVQRARERAVYEPDTSDPTVLRPVEDRLLGRAKSVGPAANVGGTERDRASAKTVEGFLRRQAEFKVARDLHRETARAEADLPCTFHPEIAAQSEVLVESNYRLWGESQKDRVERLAVQDPKRREVLREELGKLAYADCSFHPKVAEKEKLDKEDRAPPTGDDVHARLYSAKTVSAQRLEKDEKLDEECTFAPKVAPSDKYAHVKPHYNFADPGAVSRQMVSEVHSRAEKRAAAAAAKDERDLQACTFHPDVPDRRDLRASGPVVVRGLGRFLELRDLARKKAEDGAEPGKKASSGAGGVTIPQPFRLSTATRRLRRNQSAEPSFHPRTNESERRKQVLQLLEDRRMGQDLRGSLRA